MNRSVFYTAIRPMFGGTLSAAQVQVIEAILDAAAKLPREHVAYILATAFGESKMTPARENMNYSAARIRQVWPSRPEAVKFARKPRELANSVYGGRLGNRRGTDDGWNYRGGGLDQLTGRDHYDLIGIADRPEEILKPATAVKSLMNGMTTGRYRSKKLADFDTSRGFDFTAARGIVNDDVKLNGAKYAGYAAAFLSAMLKAEAAAPAARMPAAHVNETPKPEHDTPDVLTAPSFWAGIIAAIAAFFRKGK